MRYVIAVLVFASAWQASGATALAAAPCGTTSSAPGTYQHVLWIWMENHSYDDVIGNAAAPYTTQLAQQCGSASDYATVGSPSLPNYIGATAGSTFGISDDDPPGSHVLTDDNLFRQVRSAGMTEKSYEESMSGNCALTSAGTYAVKHNPAAYFAGGQDRTACQADNVPMGTTSSGSFLTDLTNGTLPNFAFITPNLCNDTHDCSVTTGDNWLQSWLPIVLNSSAYQSGSTAIFIVWDEHTPMPNVIITPSTVPGTVSEVAYNHYSLLRTTEEMLGLTTYLGAAASAPSMRGAFEQRSAPSVGGIAETPRVASPPASASKSTDRSIRYLLGAGLLAALAVAGTAGWRLRRKRRGRT